MIAVFHPDDDHSPRMFHFDCNFMLNFLDKWLFECTRTEGSTYGQMSQWEVMGFEATQCFMTNWVVKIFVRRKDVLRSVFIVSNLSHFLINPICIFIKDYKTLRTAMKRLVSRDYRTPRWMPRDQVSLTIFLLLRRMKKTISWLRRICMERVLILSLAQLFCYKWVFVIVVWQGSSSVPRLRTNSFGDWWVTFFDYFDRQQMTEHKMLKNNFLTSVLTASHSLQHQVLQGLHGPENYICIRRP